eukprot:1050675_1
MLAGQTFGDNVARGPSHSMSMTGVHGTSAVHFLHCLNTVFGGRYGVLVLTSTIGFESADVAVGFIHLIHYIHSVYLAQSVHPIFAYVPFFGSMSIFLISHFSHFFSH